MKSTLTLLILICLYTISLAQLPEYPAYLKKYKIVDTLDVGIYEVEFNYKKAKGRRAIIDKTGKIIIPFAYYGLKSTNDPTIKMFYTRKSHGCDQKWRRKNQYKGPCDPVVHITDYWYVDVLHWKILTDRYDFAEDNFQYGRAQVMRNGLYGFINKEGKEIIACQYKQICMFSNGNAIVQDSSNSYAIIDTNGVIVQKLVYDYIDLYSTPYRDWPNDVSLLKIKKNGKYGYIDINGNEILKPLYDEITFLPKMKLIKYASFVGGKDIPDNVYVQANGQLVRYDEISTFDTGSLLKVKQNNSWGIVDVYGKELIASEYNNIEVQPNGFIVLEKDKKQYKLSNPYIEKPE